MNRKFAKGLALIVASVVAVALTERARADTGAPDVVAHWVSGSGNMISEFKNIRTRWLWLGGGKPGAGLGMPALRVDTLVRLPAHWRYIRSTGEHAHLVKLESSNPRDRTIRHLAIDQTGAVGIVDLEFQAGTKIEKVSLALTAKYSNPYIVNFRRCASYNVKLKPIEREGKHLFIGFSCHEDEDSLNFYFVRSSDSKWDLGNLDKRAPQPVFRYRIQRPSENLAYEGRIMKVKTRDLDGKPIEYAVTFAPLEEPRRWDFAVGLAMTYLSYYEKGFDLKVNEYGLTGKASVYYRLIPKTLNADFTVFRTLATTGVSPSGTPDAKFMGINGRLGYRLPIELGATEWFFLGGWYWWSMYVENDAYGVNPLSGPQLFVQMFHGARNENPFYLYLKFATISDGTNFLQLTNTEYAIGGGLGLTAEARPFFLTMDLARTKFVKGLNEMSLTNISLGVTKRF